MNPNAMTSRAERTRRAILDLLADGSALTADALAERLDLSILYVRPRVSELVSQQRVVPSGECARNASGQLANKWMAA
jgi:predicted ArsR family transcriptional regulator